MTRFMFLSLALTVVFTQDAIANPIVVNGDFESTIYDSDGIAITGEGQKFSKTYGPLSTTEGWTFGTSGGDSYCGIERASSDGNFAYSHGLGTQDVFVEGTGAFYQSIHFDVGDYTLSFYAEGRHEDYGLILGPNPLSITLGGMSLTFDSQDTLSPTVGSMKLYTSDSFTVSEAGYHVLTFAGTVGFSTQDLTTYVDNVSLMSIPEPTTLAMLLSSIFGVLAYTWQKRR